jgi:hypothetical protein
LSSVQNRKYEAWKNQGNVAQGTNYAIAWDNVQANNIPGLIHDGSGKFTNYGPPRKLMFQVQSCISAATNLGEIDTWFQYNSTPGSNGSARYGHVALDFNANFTMTSAIQSTTWTFLLNTNDYVATWTYGATLSGTGNIVVSGGYFGEAANASTKLTIVEVL